MSTPELKLDLLERLIQLQDNDILRKIKALLDSDEVSEELTDDELAELEELRKRRLDGSETYVPLEEAMRMAREALKK